MKTALVTGSAGFVGRHMARELVNRDWDVDLWDIVNGLNALSLFHGGETVYDLVVHAAARAPHRVAINGQPATHLYNQLLDAAMFDWAVRTRQRRVLYLSSSAVYPIALQTGEFEYRLTESDVDLDDVAQPDARYGWTKLTGEQLARSATQAGLKVHIVRPFSGYGEDQSLDFPFPAIIARARDGDLSVWGPPGQTRDWIHIDDVVAGALAVIDAEEFRPVNLCSGRGIEMGELACLAAGKESAAVEYDPAKPTGVAYRVGDPTRMNEIYTPRVSIEEGVARALI